LRDLAQTARVLARFGPKLPRMVEAALIARAETPPPLQSRRAGSPVWMALLGAAVLAAGIVIGSRL
jgi:ubiquinone biosynthesis protein